MTNETLTMEQLDAVSGGWHYQNSMDEEFFQRLGYNMDKISLEDAFLDNGIRFDESGVSNNGYQFFSRQVMSFQEEKSLILKANGRIQRMFARISNQISDLKCSKLKI